LHMGLTPESLAGAESAYMNGVIQYPLRGITADGDVARAIVVAGDEEALTTDPHSPTYGARPGEDAATRPMVSMTSGVPVRFIRTSGSSSRFRPKGGVGYDGL
jgi:hypothetical protein